MKEWCVVERNESGVIVWRPFVVRWSVVLEKGTFVFQERPQFESDTLFEKQKEVFEKVIDIFGVFEELRMIEEAKWMGKFEKEFVSLKKRNLEKKS